MSISACIYLFSNECGKIRCHLIHTAHQVGMETLAVVGKGNDTCGKPLNVDQVNGGNIHAYNDNNIPYNEEQ